MSMDFHARVAAGTIVLDEAGQVRKQLVKCTEPSLARQSGRDEADVNFIVKRALKTGVIPDMGRARQFVDVSQVPDYRVALEQVRYAENVFMTLPAEVRGKFENNPALFLDAMVDPERRKEMEGLGLYPKEEEEAPAEAGTAGAGAAAP